jgi:O-antigen ligase/polysaccharide polymerase Wzy-like membrane protein
MSAWWLASLLAICLCAILVGARSQLSLTLLGASVGVFAGWLVGTDLWANPSYSAGALFQAALIFGGFLFARACGSRSLGLFFRVGLSFALVVALWAVSKKISEADPRAHSIFITPATLASVLNLLLAPALVVAASSAPRYSLLGVVVVLSTAFVAAQSRGGWVALIVALTFAALLMRRARMQLQTRGAAIALMAFIVGAAFAWLLDWNAGGNSPFVADAAPSLMARLDLYALALKGIGESSSLLGAGYHGFFYLLMSVSNVPEYAGRSTYFVHNDYLQALFELGLPGLAALLLLVTLPLRAVWRATPRMAGKPEAIPLIALAAAACSMAIHALVDFPFYIPVCALIFGAIVGCIDAILLEHGEVQSVAIPWPSWLRRTVIAAIATLFAWTLITPVAAEAAAEYAFHQWRGGRNQSAAYWFEAARRLDHRDWRYHWYAGQFWYGQAAETRSTEAARLAAVALAAACAANPREARSLYSRLVLHSQLRTLLAAPADGETMRAWADRSVQLAPGDATVRAERDRVFAQFASEASK